MDQDPPPEYKEIASVTRTRNSHQSVQLEADAALRSSISRNAVPPSSTDDRSTQPAIIVRRPSDASPTSPTTPVTPTGKSGGGTVQQQPSQYMSLMGGRAPRNSKDREQLLALEAEQLRREQAGQRLINQRNQIEGAGPLILSRKEQLRRVSQLKDEAREARLAAAAEASKRTGPSIFKQSTSTDLLFLIDRTYSMAPHIKSVTQQVKKIVNDIKQAFFQDAEVRVAVTTYTDHGEGPHVRSIDFTTSTASVFSFLDGLKTEGGDDIPEDVLGGVQQALKASWSQPTRCLIHIADAPPHGRIFQDEPYRRDNFPEAGTEPHGLTFEPLFQEMIGLNINYFLLPIDHTTDKMAQSFSQVYRQAAADVKLSSSNRHLSAAEASAKNMGSQFAAGFSNRSAEGRLLFVEAEAGQIYKHLRSLVVKSVLSSAPRTASRVSSSVGQMNSVFASKVPFSTQDTISETQERGLDEKLETMAPEWHNPGWLDETVRIEGFCPDIVVHGPRTLDDMMQSDDNIKMRSSDVIIHKRSRPFAQGALRTASYARTAHSTNPFVVKAFKRGGKGLAHMTEDMQCQALCKAFALEFNGLVGQQYALDFIVSTSMREKSENSEKSEKGSISERQLLSLEPFIQGNYVKFNSNCGYVNEDMSGSSTNKAAQAFSHFTFERSKGRFLVCDLQGVGNILTDPAIHTSDHDRFQLMDTNLHEDGFKFFFAYHQCNEVCRSLELKSNAQMLMSSKFDFKSEWPAKAPTVCCSNKLCGKIIRLETARQYRKFTWCDQCFLQIDATTTRFPCEANGPYHTFTASRFFYESQGRYTPRTCPTHQKKDEGLVAPTTDGNKFFKRLSFFTKNKTG